MKIERYVSDLLKSNMYVISENDRHILVDPYETDQINITGIVDYILLTHEHFDHISGVVYWKEKTNAKVMASVTCAKMCANSTKNLSRYFEALCELQTWIKEYRIPKVSDYTCKVDEVYENEYELEWMGYNVKLLECPGHSKGSSIIILNDKYVFSGDTLLRDYPTELRFPGGDKNDWIHKGRLVLEKIPGDAIILPGHFDSFNMKDYRFW